MQKIRLPDGQILQFPDGMSDDEMAQAISENFPQFAGDKADAGGKPQSSPPAAPAPAAATPAAADAPAVDSGGIAGTVQGWLSRAKQAILDVPVLAPGQKPGDQLAVGNARAQERDNAGAMSGADGMVKGGADLSDLPVTPEYLRAMQAQWNAATPEERLALAERKDHMGVVARRLNEAYPDKANVAAPDTLGLLSDADKVRAIGDQYDRTAASDQFDPTAEARARQLVRHGVRGDLAGDEARVAAAHNIPVGAEAGQQDVADATSFDFDAYKKFNNDPFWSNPAVRGAVKGYEGYKQGVLGVNQAIGEALGMDVSGQTALAKESRATTDAMGESPIYMQRQFEGVISSISQQLPALAGGAITGSEGLVLGSMFAQSFGQEYSEGRAKGQTQSDALTRAGLFGAFEVIGEKFGLGERLNLLRDMAHGVDTPVLARWMAQNLVHELPGEELTTVGQFLTDKSGVGMNKQAGVEDLLQQVADTAVATVMQGGIMSAATGGVHNAVRYVKGQAGRTAELDANDAQRDALNRWNTNGLSPSTQPGASQRVEPTWGDAMGTPAPAARPQATVADIASATNVDDAIAAAMAVADAPPNVAPVSIPSPHATAADIDALEAAAGMGAPAALEGGKPEAQMPPANLPAPVEPAPLLDSAGKSEAANDWHPFPPESRTLGVPRAQMPQIRAEHRGAMVNFLNARGVAHQEVEVNPDDLKPTQREFSISKVQQAIEHEGGNRAILISSDNYVLDGHHQWLAAAEAGEPVRAIRLNAPIKQLVKTVHEFPSATVDTSSTSTAPRPVRPGQELNDANAQRIQRQEDAVAAARESLAQRKATGGQRARERLKAQNPFLGFLASHGIHLDERSDTGGQKGRAGQVMVPGYGQVYRKSGKRLDELAQLAHEAGFLSDDDIKDPTDNAGTRKLAEMIQRAVHGKEVIQPASLLDAVAPSADQRLLGEARRLGIETEGKTADQLYDEVHAAHAGEEARREASGADSIDEQDEIDRHADQFDPAETHFARMLLDDPDIKLDGGKPMNNMTEEELDEIFGVHSRNAGKDGGQAEEGSPAPAGEGAARTGQPGEGEDLLKPYSRDDVLSREDAAAARAKAIQSERDKLEAQRKKAQEAKEARARADATVDDFQLGQDAETQLSGQRDIFAQPGIDEEVHDEPAPPRKQSAYEQLTDEERTAMKEEAGEVHVDGRSAYPIIVERRGQVAVEWYDYRTAKKYKTKEAARAALKEAAKQPQSPAIEAYDRQEFDAKSGVGKIVAARERYSDKFGVSWASTNIATTVSMADAEEIARAVAESGADNIKDMRRIAQDVQRRQNGIARDGMRDSDRHLKNLDGAVEEFTVQTKEELDDITPAEVRAGALQWAKDANLDPGEFLRALYRKWTRNKNNLELQELADSLLQGEAEQGPAPTSEAKSTPPVEDINDGSDIPLAFYGEIMVKHRVYSDDGKTSELMDVPSDVALESVRDDINSIEAMLKCMGA